MTNWKPVVGFEKWYRVSDEGNVSSVHTGKLLKPAKVGAGYLRVCLFQYGKGHNKYVHRIVAETFFGDGDGREVNHRNGNKEDNRIQNLEWVTRSENVKHNYYELGYRITPIYAIRSDNMEVLEFKSIEEAVRSGFLSAHIYACLRGERKQHKGFKFVYQTTPPQRTWVGLTDEEIQTMWQNTSPYYDHQDFALAIEAKLKEKNT